MAQPHATRLQSRRCSTEGLKCCTTRCCNIRCRHDNRRLEALAPSEGSPEEGDAAVAGGTVETVKDEGNDSGSTMKIDADEAKPDVATEDELQSNTADKSSKTPAEESAIAATTSEPVSTVKLAPEKTVASSKPPHTSGAEKAKARIRSSSVSNKQVTAEQVTSAKPVPVKFQVKDFPSRTPKTGACATPIAKPVAVAASKLLVI